MKNKSDFTELFLLYEFNIISIIIILIIIILIIIIINIY